MIKTPKVSVIILTWNRKKDVLETISEVKSSTYNNIEIIVVDNASSDGTKHEITNNHKEVFLVELDENKGIAGYNEGIKKAAGKYILLLDSDSFPESDCIEKMVNYFEKDPSLGVAAFDVQNYNFRSQKNKKSPPDEVIEVTGYNGAGVGISKKCFDAAGLLFEPYFLYLNEQDHSLRILSCGYKISLFTDLVAYHKQSIVGRNNEKMAYYYTRNLLWLVWRFYPVTHIVHITFQIFFFTVIYSFFQKTTIYIKAVKDAINGVNMVLSTRKPVSSKIIRAARIPVKLAFSVYR